MDEMYYPTTFLAAVCLLGALVSARISPAQEPAQRLDEATAAAVKYQVVPKIQGKYPALARQLLRLADLKFAEGVFYIAPQNWRDDIRPGVVYLQVPPPKSPLRSESTVAGWMFAKAGPDQEIVEMPDLKGLSGSAVRAELKELNLSLMKGASIPEDALVVGDQYPRPGQQIYEQTSVQLLWSKE